MTSHVGKIIISEEVILRWLDFYPEGRIRNIRMGNYGQIEVELEHPEMPEIKTEGASLQIVTPSYITTTDSMGHSVTVRQKLNAQT